MNHIYRLIWNEATATFVAVAENARARGKRSSTVSRVTPAASGAGIVGRVLPAIYRKVVGLSPTYMFVLLAAFATSVHALPTGGAISAGSGSIAQTGATMTVDQSSQNLAVNWQTFNIGASETVNFVQPNSSAIALNRVHGVDGTQILGNLNANGQVWVLNPNGVLFGRTAQVNVGGLVASTLGISDADFLAGKRTFSSPLPQAGEGSGVRVVNQGAITANYVALLGGQVSNEGVIAARLGTVALAAGNKITLDFNGDQLLNVQVEQGALDALAENKQLIRADGGTVLMTAQAADALASAVVNNTGVIEARSIENREGRILLLGDMRHGTVNVGGTLDASAETLLPSPFSLPADGGFIETSAAHVKVADGAVVTTQAANGLAGSWLIDPVDFTIASGSGALTTSGIGATTLSTSLGSGNVSIATDAGTAGNGDIFVNAAVNWSANKLTLTAHRNININANLNGSGTASLRLEYAQGGGGGAYSLANGAKVSLPAGLNFTTKNGGAAAIDWTVITGLGVEGDATVAPGVMSLQGMNTGLAGNYVLGADIPASGTSSWNTNAGFVAVGNSGTKFTGSFDGLGHTVTGLTINRPDWLVPANNNQGLFGYAGVGSTLRNVGLLNSSIYGAYAVGALAGHSDGAISNSYADGGSATASVHQAGGLVGFLGDGVAGHGSIGNSYANVSVSGANGGGAASSNIGGLVGQTSTGSSISNSYSTGSVNGSTYVGGLVGQNRANISNSYASGAVTSVDFGGGFIGDQLAGTITDSYWDSATTTKAARIGHGAGGTVTSLTDITAAPNAQASYTGFDFAGSWRIYEGNTRPLLKNFLTALTVTATSGSKTYDGTTTGLGVSYSTAPNANLLGTAVTTSASSNVGTWAVSASGLYSNQRGYDITYVAGALTIDPVPLILLGITATDAAKTYGTAYTFTGTEFISTGLQGGETIGSVTLTSTGAPASAPVGSYAIVPSNASGGTFNPANYDITYANGTLTVSPAPLTVTAGNAVKTYDGLAWSGNNGVSYNGFVNGEGAGVLGGALVYGGNAQGAVGAGSYAITPSGLTSGNYTIGYVDGALTVNSAPLAVTANDVSRFYDGIAWSGGNGVTYSGFVNGETGAVLGGALVYGGNSQGAVDAGSYAITPGGLTSGNYTIAFNDGMLSIEQRIPAIPGAPVDSYAGATDREAGTASNAVEGTSSAVEGTSGAIEDTSAVAPVDNAAGGETSVKLSPDADSGAAANQYVLVTQACGLRLPEGLDCR